MVLLERGLVGLGIGRANRPPHVAHIAHPVGDLQGNESSGREVTSLMAHDVIGAGDYNCPLNA
jgi:hypothetical protein